MDEFIKQLTRRAGQLVMRQFGKTRVTRTKRHPADVVSAADEATNRLLAAAIRRRFPDHGIISEEQDDHQAEAEHTWIIDPLDGSRNFVTGTPLFAVMVGLARKGVMERAAIYDPVNRALYFARRSRGAYRNGRRIRCSKQRSWAYSFGTASSSLNARKIGYLQPLLASAARQPFWLTTFGSTGVCAMYVADGRRDWWLSCGAAPWDYAAPALLLEEAGCTVTDFSGRPWNLKAGEVLAATPYLHRHLLTLVRKRR